MVATKFLSLLALSAGFFAVQICAAPMPQVVDDNSTPFVNQYVDKFGVTHINGNSGDPVPAGIPGLGGKFENVVEKGDLAHQGQQSDRKTTIVDAQPPTPEQVAPQKTPKQQETVDLFQKGDMIEDQPLQDIGNVGKPAGQKQWCGPGGCFKPSVSH
ncbi:hypothetical protein ABW20_dc0108052 [Dactylellina cionopaga]|nr:hypothetical protein ABW20_dc0108052 [Dactylellina cionopaga]